MSRRREIPTYRLHKSSNRGVVTLGARDYFLGRYDTPESRQRYDRLIQGWLARPLGDAAGGCNKPAPLSGDKGRFHLTRLFAPLFFVVPIP